MSRGRRWASKSADGWSRSYTPKQLNHVGLGGSELRMLVREGMARPSKYFPRRFELMTTVLTKETVKELLAALGAAKRLRESNEEPVGGHALELNFDYGKGGSATRKVWRNSWSGGWT